MARTEAVEEAVEESGAAEDQAAEEVSEETEGVGPVEAAEADHQESLRQEYEMDLDYMHGVAAFTQNPMWLGFWQFLRALRDDAHEKWVEEENAQKAKTFQLTARVVEHMIPEYFGAFQRSLESYASKPGDAPGISGVGEDVATAEFDPETGILTVTEPEVSLLEPEEEEEGE